MCLFMPSGDLICPHYNYIIRTMNHTYNGATVKLKHISGKASLLQIWWAASDCNLIGCLTIPQTHLTF